MYILKHPYGSAEAIYQKKSMVIFLETTSDYIIKFDYLFKLDFF